MTPLPHGNNFTKQLEWLMPDTKTQLEELAASVIEMAEQRQDPAIAIPARSLGNISYNERTKHIEMGDGKQSRSLFNYGQAKRFCKVVPVRRPMFPARALIGAA